MKLRTIILWGVLLLILGWSNLYIFQKEQLMAQGQSIFLELAPRDPRSLIQGDYMALRYEMIRDLENQADLPSDGLFVIALDQDNTATLVRVYDEQTLLQPGERLLRYRKRGPNVRLGAESFFFEEGQAEAYDEARYAELKVTESGDSILIDLRGPDLELLGPLP